MWKTILQVISSKIVEAGDKNDVTTIAETYIADREEIIKHIIERRKGFKACIGFDSAKKVLIWKTQKPRNNLHLEAVMHIRTLFSPVLIW